MKLVKSILAALFGTSTPSSTPTSAAEAKVPAAVEVKPTLSKEEEVEAECKQICAIVEGTAWPGRGPRRPYVERLIDIAETMEYLKKALEYATDSGLDDREKWSVLWSKWLEKATDPWDMYRLHSCELRMSNEQQTALVRKWYVLADTFHDIRLIPNSKDEVLNDLVHTKKVQIVQKELGAASTCEKLLDVWRGIDPDFRPTSLVGYAGWNNDEGLTAKRMHSLCEYPPSEGPVLKAEANEKWLKVCLREIEAIQSTVDIAVLAGHIHPDAKQSLIEKWDSLSATEVAKTVEEQALAEALHRSRTGSVAAQTAFARLEAISLERVQKASTLGELWGVISEHWVPNDYPSIRLAIEKYAGLATTEEDIRKIWPWTKEMSGVRNSLSEKLSALIK